MKKILTLIAILAQVFTCKCQSDSLEYLNRIIIGPQNVAIQFEEQVDFYKTEYFEMIKTLENDLDYFKSEIRYIKSKKKIKKREKEELIIFDENSILIENEIKQLENYINLWENNVFDPGDLDFLKMYRVDECIEIVGSNGIYSPKEYKVVDLSNVDSLRWMEEVDFLIKSVEVKKGKWTKVRDYGCESADPEDCFFVAYEEEIHFETEESCPEGFDKDEFNKHCIRHIVFPNNKKELQRIKVINPLTKKEIEIFEFRKVVCN